MAHLCKRKDVPTEIVHVVKQKSVELYVKVMVRRLTTSEATELGGLRVFQLGLLVVQQIAAVNPSVLKLLF